MNTKQVLLIIGAVILVALTFSSVTAYSGFPTRTYPGNQYGFGYRYYDGPWGERMVYGGPGYFPNYNGYAPYGYRTYGHMYSPWDMRWGTTMQSTMQPWNARPRY
jgi:hypothetical protein